MIDREAKVTIEREDAPFDLLRSMPCLVCGYTSTSQNSAHLGYISGCIGIQDPKFLHLEYIFFKTKTSSSGIERAKRSSCKISRTPNLTISLH